MQNIELIHTYNNTPQEYQHNPSWHDKAIKYYQSKLPDEHTNPMEYYEQVELINLFKEATCHEEKDRFLLLLKEERQKTFSWTPPIKTENAIHLNPYTCPKSYAAKEALHDIADKALERDSRLRINNKERARKRSDIEKIRNTIISILSNLALALELHPTSGAVIISRSKRVSSNSRYTPKWYTVKIAIAATKILSQPDNNFITIKMGSYNTKKEEGAQTAIFPRTLLTELLSPLSNRDFGEIESRELIILKDEKEGWTKKSRADHKRIEYTDNPFTNNRRKELMAINKYLEVADVSFDVTQLATPEKTMRE